MHAAQVGYGRRLEQEVAESEGLTIAEFRALPDAEQDKIHEHRSTGRERPIGTTDESSEAHRRQADELRVEPVPKVLIIHFDAPIRLLSRVNLENAGMEVIEAEDGDTGLEKARMEVPDVILLDVNLPRTVQRTRRLGREKLHYPGWPDGWRVAEQLHEDPATREIPFIFLTPRAEFNDRRRGLELGAVDYVTHPFNPLELAGLIEDVIHRRARNELDDLRREKAADLRQLIEEDTTTG
jgi:DNA-binding response OmpR family regulator